MSERDAPRPAPDAATLERLRRRYTPRQPRCSVCDGVMAADETIGVVGGILSRAWYCVAAVEAPRGAPGLDAHLSRGGAVVPVGDPDVLALLAAYAAAAARADALAGEVARLRAALEWYADELRYSRLVGDPLFAAAPVLVDGGTRARAALASAAGEAGAGDGK